MSAPENCLIIGIDYGTTYTGAAFRPLKFQNGILQHTEIQPVIDWPPDKVETKVPSAISYAAGSGGERQWGLDIDTGTSRLTLTKLQLEHQEPLQELQNLLKAVMGMELLDISRVNQTNGLASSYSREPEDIVADYLSGIREYLVPFIQGIIPATYLSSVPIDLVVTVPAGWSDDAKDRTLRAFRKAGFDNKTPFFARLREVIMFSEPEAAALYTVRNLTELEGDEIFRPGDCFVVCDAGGGTVDLISYQITQTVPALKIEEVGFATGGRCGASFIDGDFQKLLKQRLGPENFQRLVLETAESAIGSHTTISSSMQEIMNDFEPMKREFDGTSTEVSISLPRVLNDLDNVPEKGIVGGEIEITDKDLQPIFDKWVNKTLELIQGQISQVKHEGLNVRHIFLSGGFAESPYLQKKVKNFARLQRIQVKMSKNPWLAVVYGAVTKGIEQVFEGHARGTRIRRHYGVSTSQPFSSFRHSEEDAYSDPFDGEKKAGKQMSWLIRKGDLLLPGQSKTGTLDICRKFGVGDTRVFKTTVVGYDDDYAPQRHGDLHNGGAQSFFITYDLSAIPENRFGVVRGGARGQPYFSASLSIEIELQTTLLVKVTMDGEIINSVVKPYV